VSPAALAAAGTVPGKLMIAGEYAVLAPDGCCLAVAVGQLARWRLAQPAGEAILTLQAFDKTWQWPVAALLQGQLPQGLGSFAAGALRAAAERWPATLPLPSMDLQVAGSVGGAKLGLGTSAAVTVAVLSAWAAAQHQLTEPADLAALGRQVHHTLQNGQGSGYDVTTQAMGGVVAYRRSPDRAEPLGWPTGLYGLALYTGEPAATQKHLDGQQPGAAALAAIAVAARKLLADWSSAGPAQLLSQIADCERAFDLAAADAPHLLPASVQTVRQQIAAAGCVARTSGAGGGDCVWAFATDPATLQALANAWTAASKLVVARVPQDLQP